MSRDKKGTAFYAGNSWYHRVKILKDDGSVSYSKRGGFITAAEAEQGYLKYDKKFKKEYRNYQISHNLDRNVSFGDYLQYWFEEIFSARVENTTRMVGAYTLYDLILPNVDENIKLKCVNTDYLNALLEMVSLASASAGNKSRELLNLALKEAVIAGYMKNNPVMGTKTYPRMKPGVTILSKEMLRVLLGAAAKSEWYLEILLGVFCGLRKGEIQGLKFDDFDRKEKTVSIKRQITSNPIIPRGQSKIETYSVVEKPPKTDNSYRTLRVPDEIMAELDNRRSLVEEYKNHLGEEFRDCGYISCQENGLPHSVTAMNAALTKLCRRNSLPHITVHGLRHMYATILIEQGVPLVKISALLGHSSINTTFEYYCDVMDENERIISFMNTQFIPERG